MRKFLKLFCIILCFALCFFFAACKNDKTPSEPASQDPASSESAPEPEPIKLNINPLTGLEALTDEEVNFKPVALMVNNVDIAQPVQSGIESADVVFEAFVEGGITRLLALYKAPRAEMGRIGTVRSARVVFAELAASMNAVYIHHGQDAYHYPSRADALKLPRIVISPSTNGERIKNGKSSEHTLYTSGEKLRNEIINKGYNKGNASEPWLNFSAEKQAGANPAKSVTVKFSGAAVSNFTYDEATSSYIRGAKGTVLKNYFTGQEARFTNVFVLYTSAYSYGSTHNDGSVCKHTKVELKGGSGFYVTKGGYEKISWSKSGSFEPIKFKAEDGQALEVSAGNSFICLVNKNTSNAFTAE